MCTQERAEMIKHLNTRPEAMWRTGTQWTFKNEAKVYGSPAFDAAWVSMVGKEQAGMVDPLPVVLSELDKAALPFEKVYAKKGRGKGAAMSAAVRTGRKRSRKDDDDFLDDDDLSGIDFSMM